MDSFYSKDPQAAVHISTIPIGYQLEGESTVLSPSDSVSDIIDFSDPEVFANDQMYCL